MLETLSVVCRKPCSSPLIRENLFGLTLHLLVKLELVAPETAILNEATIAMLVDYIRSEAESIKLSHDVRKILENKIEADIHETNILEYCWL